jgi:hypothetical protein
MGREGTDMEGTLVLLLREESGCGLRKLFARPSPPPDFEDEVGRRVDVEEDFEKGFGKKEVDFDSDLNEVEKGIAGEGSIRAPGR